MQIAARNVNSLPVCLPQVFDWLGAIPVDVLALQEFKLTHDKFPALTCASVIDKARRKNERPSDRSPVVLTQDAT